MTDTKKPPINLGPPPEVPKEPRVTELSFAFCACLEVRYSPIDNGDGTNTERWVCTECGCEFRRDLKPDVEEMDRRLTDLERWAAEDVERHPIILTIKGGALNQEDIETLKKVREKVLECPEVHEMFDGNPCPGTCIQLARDLEDARVALEEMTQSRGEWRNKEHHARQAGIDLKTQCDTLQEAKLDPKAEAAIKRQYGYQAEITQLAVKWANVVDNTAKSRAMRDLINKVVEYEKFMGL